MGEGKHCGRPRIDPALEERIRAALNKLGRTEGVRKIADRFGVAANPIVIAPPHPRTGKVLGANEE
jgi:hypothetical protein